MFARECSEPRSQWIKEAKNQTYRAEETFTLNASDPDVRKGVLRAKVTMDKGGKESDVWAKRFQRFSSLSSLQRAVANLSVVAREFYTMHRIGIIFFRFFISTCSCCTKKLMQWQQTSQPCLFYYVSSTEIYQSKSQQMFKIQSAFWIQTVVILRY